MKLIVSPTPIQVTQSVQNRVFSRAQSVDNSVSKTASDQIVSKTVDTVVAKTLKLDVSYHAVTRAHTVPLHGLPQKKGLSPDQSLNRIKHVKGVCCVNSCLSNPLVPNVPNAVIEQSVGGRLQKFWHIWQVMGANLRVVLVLRDGYILPFKQSPRGSKWLCQSSKEPVLKRGLTQFHEQVGSRKSGCQVVGILQPTFPCPQTKQKMETNFGSKSIESIPQYQYIQDANPGNNPVILTDRGMGDFAGLQRCVFPHSSKSKVTKIFEVFPVQSDIPSHSPSLWSGYGSP